MTSRSKRNRIIVSPAAAKPVKQYPELVGLTLDEAVKRVKGDIYVGAARGSSFFLIGSKVVYERDIDDWGCDLRQRVEELAYDKLEPREGIIILIDGDERGSFWSKSEYYPKAKIQRECIDYELY